jgi:hypothetical protein
VRITDRMQRPVERLLPEIQKFSHLRKHRRQIIVLPDIGSRSGPSRRCACYEKVSLCRNLHNISSGSPPHPQIFKLTMRRGCRPVPAG